MTAPVEDPRCRRCGRQFLSQAERDSVRDQQGHCSDCGSDVYARPTREMNAAASGRFADRFEAKIDSIARIDPALAGRIAIAWARRDFSRMEPAYVRGVEILSHGRAL